MSTEGALFEAVVFLDFFADLPDPRQRAKVVYPLNEVLLLSLMAVLAGAETFTDMALFGQKKLGLLRRFLPFANGTPPHDRLGEIFAALDPEKFRACFAAWAGSFVGVAAEVIAIDGKTSRRSFVKKGETSPIHMVSAFAARQRLVLGQVKVADKSNEIIAIPKLMDLLDLEGSIVTLDAMGCQRAIAQKALDKKADYVMALKGNQTSLRDDVELFVQEQKARAFKDVSTSRGETLGKDHGRIETRTTTVVHDMAWLRQRHDWPGLNSLVIVEAVREIGGKTERETRFYITSLTDPAEKISTVIRDHWAIENSLHWILDVVFRDDDCRVRSKNAPENFAMLRHVAVNLTRSAPARLSLRSKRKIAAWDDDFLVSILKR